MLQINVQPNNEVAVVSIADSLTSRKVWQNQNRSALRLRYDNSTPAEARPKPIRACCLEQREEMGKSQPTRLLHGCEFRRPVSALV